MSYKQMFSAERAVYNPRSLGASSLGSIVATAPCMFSPFVYMASLRVTRFATDACNIILYFTLIILCKECLTLPWVYI